jgi:HK97 gp10 family phage protein
MKAGIKINQSDLAKLNKKLAQLQKFSKQELSSEIGRGAQEIVGRAKQDAKYDNGDLRGSISSQASGKGVAVIADAEYAPYVEFGTGTKVSLTDMKELGIPDGYAAQFKGKGIREVNLPARPFFFSSARVGFNNMLKRVDKKLKKLL